MNKNGYFNIHPINSIPSDRGELAFLFSTKTISFFLIFKNLAIFINNKPPRLCVG